MTHFRKQQRRYCGTLLGTSVVSAFIASSLSITAAEAISSEINVTIVPGKKYALGDWVAHQTLDVTGATRLLGDNMTPNSDSVRVDEYDESGQIIASLPSQFDVESKDPLVGTLSWPVEAMTAGQLRHFRISWTEEAPDEPAVTYNTAPLQVEETSTAYVVSNQSFQVSHDKSRGGLWSRLVFLPSGKATDQTIWRDGMAEYELQHDSSPEVSVIASGPLRVVIEVKARYLNPQGKAPRSRPRATYRYTYLAGQPYVHIETTVEQDDAVDWPELRIGDILPDFKFFTQYWMDHFSGKHWNNNRDLRHMGSFSTLYRNHAMLLGDHAYFCFAGPMVKFWDAGKSPDSYLRAHWKPWRTKRMQYAFYAQLDGSDDGHGLIVGRRHKFHAFVNQFVLDVPPHIALDVQPLRKKSEEQLSTFYRRQATLSTLSPIKKTVANFALNKARIHLANGNVSLNNGLFSRVSDLFQAASDDAKNIIFEDLTWQTKVRHGDALGLEICDLLILVNRDMAIAIDREKLNLRGLFQLATEKEFVSISEISPARDLINLTLLTPDHQEIDALGFAEAKHSHQWRQTDGGIELVLRWQGIDMPHEPNVIDVEGVIRIGPRGMSHWSCQVNNRSRDLGLRYITFPVIGPLHAGTEESPTDYNSSGTPNPTVKTGEGSLGHSYYGSRGGVYYHPQDSHWYKKRQGSRVDAATRTGTYEHSYIAVNSHGEQIKSFNPTYEIAVGVFEGDWYDVARIYRRWAITQPWCSKGTIAQRDDLPDWFKQLDFIDQAAALTQEQFDVNLQLGRNHNQSNGHHGPIGMWMTHWMQYKFDNKYPDYFPPLMGENAFKQAVTEGHKLGLYYMPYVNAFIYATNAPSFTAEARENASMTLDGLKRGGTIAYGEKNMPYVWMCPATKFWQDKFSEIGRKIIQEYDCDGMYYDQVHVSGEECGDPSHGHPVGGGNCRIEGVRELYDRVRRESLAKRKKIVFSSEYWCEAYIGTCDMALQQYSTADTRGEFISQVIYHDYLQTYGYAYLSQPFFPYVGSLYLSGVYGPTNLASKNNIGGDEPNPGRLKFIHYLSNCRQAFGIKYLNLGARLRNPLILTDLPLIDRGQKRSGERLKPTPAIITSAWEAGDGDIGCFFMNISNERQAFEYEIDLSRFALDSLGTYTVTKRQLGQDTILHDSNPGRVRTEDELESNKLFLIEFQKR